MQDSNAAIAKVAGQSLPEGFHIKVIENDPAYNATFVLPDMTSDELSDDELNQIAGGVCQVYSEVKLPSLPVFPTFDTPTMPGK